MDINLITTETITDENILKYFGDALCCTDGRFNKNTFFESIEGFLDMYDFHIADTSRKDIMERLQVLLMELMKNL